MSCSVRRAMNLDPAVRLVHEPVGAALCRDEIPTGIVTILARLKAAPASASPPRSNSPSVDHVRNYEHERSDGTLVLGT